METTANPRRLALIVAPVALLLGAGAGYLLGANGTSTGGTHSMHSASSSSAAAVNDADGGLADLTTQASVDQHNDADIAFAQMMIPHHAQAVEMAKLAPTRSQSQQVKDLAAQIEAAQQPEIDAMTAWLGDWGADAAPAGTDHSNHASHGQMEGMMSAEEMTKLAAMSGTEFDQAFLAMMVEHHRGAIAMAQEELANGKYAPTLAMAAAVQITQQAEIQYMGTLVRS